MPTVEIQVLQLLFLLGMATNTDFNTRVLGHSSDRVLGYSEDFPIHFAMFST